MYVEYSNSEYKRANGRGVRGRFADLKLPTRVVTPLYKLSLSSLSLFFFSLSQLLEIIDLLSFYAAPLFVDSNNEKVIKKKKKQK